MWLFDVFFFFNDTATPKIYTLSLHDALPIFETNPRAMKTYEAAGFIREGVLRQEIFKNGRYIDVIMMGILQNEWMQKQEK